MVLSYSAQAIDLDYAAHAWPVLTALPHADVSNRYEHIPTIEVLRALDKEGFKLHGVDFADVRKEDREGFQKHLLRLRHVDSPVAEYAPELILKNAHDGSSSYNLWSGIMRFICANGIIVGDKWSEARVVHKGNDVVEKVIEGTYKVVEDFGRIDNVVNEWKAIELQPEQAEVYAKAAVALRYEEGKAPVSPQLLLAARRQADKKADLWSTFNRVQEGLIRGGARQYDAVERRVRSVRRVSGIDATVGINRALWTLTEEMAKLAK